MKDSALPRPHSSLGRADASQPLTIAQGDSECSKSTGNIMNEHPKEERRKGLENDCQQRH